MINGYLLRDVINKVNGIHFTASEEIHTLGNFYESMLKEMRMPLATRESSTRRARWCA